MKKRILVDNYGPDLENLKKAFSVAISIADKEKKNISIVVPTLNNLDAVEKAFGDSFVKHLKKKDVVVLENGVTMNLLTDITMAKKTRYPIFLCLYNSHYQMEKIDKFNGIEHEIYLPWMEEDITHYNKHQYQKI